MLSNTDIESGRLDINIAELTFGKCPVVVKTGHSHICKYKDCCGAKVPGMQKQLEMMIYACVISIAPYGHVLKGEEQVGIVMKLGEPVDVTVLDNDSKRKLINGILNL